MVLPLTAAQIEALTDDELEALEDAINVEKKRRWHLRRQPSFVEDLRQSLQRPS